MKESPSNLADTLLIDPADSVVVLTLNRPPANALDSGLISKLLATVKKFAIAESPPCIVLTGQGTRFFTAGGDIKEALSLDTAAATVRLSMLHVLLCEMERYPAPIICAVRGYAVGGGFELVLHADHVVADPAAQFGFPEIKNGLLPAAKGIRKAMLKLGQHAAKTMLYSGDLIDAEHAKTLGCIDEIVATEDVVSRAVAAGLVMRQKDPRLFAAIKRSLHQTLLATDDELEAISAEDMKIYFGNEQAADARAGFFKRAARD